MERRFRIAIVIASWTMMAGLLVAVGLPPVISYTKLSGVALDDVAAVGAAMSDAARLSNWSLIVGLGTFLIGGVWLAITLSRWFLRREDISTPNI
jgi:hypothetical protein